MQRPVGQSDARRSAAATIGSQQFRGAALVEVRLVTGKRNHPA
jgi:hypothetical protein